MHFDVIAMLLKLSWHNERDTNIWYVRSFVYIKQFSFNIFKIIINKQAANVHGVLKCSPVLGYGHKARIFLLVDLREKFSDLGSVDWEKKLWKWPVGWLFSELF